MSERLRITDVVRVPLRELDVVGDIEIVAHLHLAASWPHAPCLELLHDPPVGDYRHLFAVLNDPPEVAGDGGMAVPTGPGLGVSIDPDAVAWAAVHDMLTVSMRSPAPGGTFDAGIPTS